jgi:hypothetical protein
MYKERSKQAITGLTRQETLKALREAKQLGQLVRVKQLANTLEQWYDDPFIAWLLSNRKSAQAYIAHNSA